MGTATSRSKYVEQKAGAGPAGRKKLMKGNIGDWKFLKRMEIKEREKDETVASRAKGKAKGVIGTRTGAGGVVSALGAAQGMLHSVSIKP